MINTAKLGLAAALFFGVASTALAGEGSPDLSYPPGYEYSAPAPRAAAQQTRVFAGSDNPLDAYALDHQGVRPFTRQEQQWFDRSTGSADNSP